MKVSKILDLFRKSLYQVVSKKDIIYTYIFVEFDSQKGDSELPSIVTPSHRYHTRCNAAEKNQAMLWIVSQKLFVVLKSERKTFYLAIPFCFNENT